MVQGQREVRLGPRNFLTLAATDLFGAFFDTTYAFRFGPPAHEVCFASLISAQTGFEVASAFHFPRGRHTALHASAIEASLSRDDADWLLTLRADRFAQSVNLSFEGWTTSDNWFHLQPGFEKKVRLTRRGAEIPSKPSGSIGHLGSRMVVSL